MKSTSRIFTVLLGVTLLALSSNAQNLDWGSGGAGGLGMWDDGTNVIWFNGTMDVPWSAGNTATFGGTAGTVTVSGTIPGINGITFNTTGYTLSGGTLTMSGATPVITIGNGFTAAINSAIVAGAGTTIGGGGFVSLGGANTGVLTIGTDTTVQTTATTATLGLTSLTVNGTLDVLVGGGNASGFPTLAGNGLITTTAGSLQSLRIAGTGTPVNDFSGDITGNLQVLYQGAGTQILSGNNTHTGFVLLRNSGTLRLASAGALSANTYLEFQGGTQNTLELASGDFVRPNGAVAGGLRFNGGNNYFAAVGGDRMITITNAANDMTWGVGAFNTAVLGFGSANADGTAIWTGNFSLGNAGRTIGVVDGPAAIEGEIRGVISSSGTSGGISKTGAGTLLLSGTNTYQGTTSLSAGEIAIANDSALGTGNFRFHLANAVLRSANSETRTLNNFMDIATDPIFGSAGTGDLILNGTVSTGAGAKKFTIRNAVTTINGDITGASANPITKAGTGTLLINSVTSYAKPTIIDEGTLKLGASGAIDNSPSILVNADGIFDVSAVSGGYILGADQTISGTGTVLGDSTIAGTLAPGTSIGTLSFIGDLTLAGTSLFEIEKTGMTLSSDKLIATGTIHYDGLLTVIASGDALAEGDVFTLFTASTFAGMFSTFDLSSPGSGLSWNTDNLGVDGTIIVVPEPTSLSLVIGGALTLLLLRRRR